MATKILYNGKEYSSEDKTEPLISASAFVGDSLPSVQLTVDTLRATVHDVSDTPISEEFLYGSPVILYHDNVMIGQFRLESIKRVGRYDFQLEAISAVGLLLTSYHYGGIYNGEKASDVIADVIGSVITYTLDSELGETPIFGLLRKSTRRDNLRDILFAIGGQIRKDGLGQLNIVPITEKQPYEISPNHIYNTGSVTGTNPASSILVTEHSFYALPTDKDVVLFDGESAAENLVSPKGNVLNGVLVDFSEPMHDLKAINTEVLESGANYAVISGSPAATLTGLQYAHTERIISRSQNTSSAPNVVKSSSCELVNLFNSELVADRLMAYYGTGKTVNADFVLTNQKSGDLVEFLNPFMEKDNGFISNMELTMSRIIKARAEIITGFIPTPSGNFYSKVIKITESGTFVVPNDCKGKIRVVLIGGGGGGESGQNGESGEMGEMGGIGRGNPGNGGIAGRGGAAGKIFVATIKADVGSSHDVVIGVGGSDYPNGETPTLGEPSTFDTITSENGYSPENGYSAMYDQKIYALSGSSGVNGGRGQDESERPTVQFDGQEWIAGDIGGRHVYENYTAMGGSGGGAAVGSNGEKGKNGSVSSQPFADGGDGGNGASATITGHDGSTPGSGGGGGHGGGGGGGGGGATGGSNAGEHYYWPGSGGLGGIGSKGGKGADGIVLIYY